MTTGESTDANYELFVEAASAREVKTFVSF